MRRTTKLLICNLFLAAIVYSATSLPSFVFAVSSVSAQTQIEFKRDIEPILAQSCYQCHGAKKAAGQLRLDVKALALKGGISGAAIIPGNRDRKSVV